MPGPDPMPIWLTLAIGLTGSIVGAVVGQRDLERQRLRDLVPLVRRRDRARRRLPAVRPAAADLRAGRATRSRARARRRAARASGCSKLGIDPNALRAAIRARLEHARLEAMLEELHRAGVLDDEELAAKRAALDTRVAPRRTSSP